MNRFAGLALLIAFVGVSCHPPDSGWFGRTRPKHPPDEIWINNASEPESIDPATCSESNGGEVIWNSFAGLVQAHPKTLAPMPDVAERWDVSADRKLYTFHLRESRWSDGTRFTARDFEGSWKRVLDPATGSKYASIFYPIANAEAFHSRAVFVSGLPETVRTKEDLKPWIADPKRIERVTQAKEPAGLFIFVTGDTVAERDANRREVLKIFGAGARIADVSFVGVKAPDDLTLTVRLESAIPYFLDLVSYYSYMPVPRHVLERLRKEGKNPDLWTRPENFVSNGAFVLKKWAFRRVMDFEKNPLYWDAARTRPHRVRAFMVEHLNTALNLYETADFDWSGRSASLPSEFLDRLSAFKDFHRDPYLSLYFYWLNTKAKPLDNPKLRKALSLAVDRPAIVKYVTRAQQAPTADLVPDGLAGYKGPKTPVFDPDQARKLLREAGYESGEKVPPITLSYNTSEGHRMIAEAIQQMWKKELGLRVTLDNQEWKVFLSNQTLMNFQISRHGWVGDYPDPFTFLEILMGGNGNNHANWSNREYDDLLRRANQTVDAAERLKTLRTAEDILVRETPVIPVYVYTRNYLKKPYLKGHWGNFQDRHPWKYFSIDTRWYEP